MPLHVRLVGGGLGTTLRILIWWDVFCGNVPVFIHVHVADGIGHTLEQVSGLGAQDTRRNVAVNVHVMKRLLLCVFSHAAVVSDLSGGGLGTTFQISIWRDFFCGNVPVFIHEHVADGIGHTLGQGSRSRAQDNWRNMAVNVHVMKCLLLCVFSHAAACQTCRGVG